MGIIPDRYIKELSKSVRLKWPGSGKQADETGHIPSRGGMKGGLAAVSPVIVFLAVYLISSLVAGDFYKIPISAAFLIASVYSVLICRGKTLEERITIFSEGAGNRNVLLMIWIFVLAGTFAETAREIGAIDATVNLALRILPGRFIYAGLFLAACFISMSIGTSVGTIVALVPVAAGIAGEISSGAEAAGMAAETVAGLPFMTAIITGGAFFGDNLSFISDTTIASTRTQGCPMADKFKVNIRITGLAAIVVTGIYVFLGSSSAGLVPEAGPIEWVLIIPYIAVIALAISGIDVAAVLAIGILANAVIGFASGSLSWTAWLESAGRGISGMGDLITVTLLAGGMLEVIRANGGLDFITSAMTRRINSKRGAELSIAALVSFANLCTANNTIAIITTGQIAKDITRKFSLDPRKTASILDTFSCLVQGLLPYGAQLLMAAGLAHVSSISIIGYLYYPFTMGVFAIAAILLRLPRRYS